jgi:hypothetical protein
MVIGCNEIATVHVKPSLLAKAQSTVCIITACLENEGVVKLYT